jgi:hypothetical protein
MSGACLANAIPKAGVASLGGLILGGALVAAAEGSGLAPNSLGFVVGFSLGQALVLKYLWD